MTESSGEPRFLRAARPLVVTDGYPLRRRPDKLFEGMKGSYAVRRSEDGMEKTADHLGPKSRLVVQPLLPSPGRRNPGRTQIGGDHCQEKRVDPKNLRRCALPETSPRGTEKGQMTAKKRDESELKTASKQRQPAHGLEAPSEWKAKGPAQGGHSTKTAAF